MHRDSVLSLCANVDLTSPVLPGFVRDENINQSDSDYESDYRLEIANGGAASSEIDDDMQNESTVEDVSHARVCGRPSSQQTISGAGRHQQKHTLRQAHHCWVRIPGTVTLHP